VKLIRTLAATAAVALALCASTPAFAGTQVGPDRVTSLKVSQQRYSVFFYYNQLIDQPPCYSAGGSWFYVDFTHPKADQMYATLLAASLAGKSVYFVYENTCNAGEVLITSVTLIP
jgi:hypothetical protein